MSSGLPEWFASTNSCTRRALAGEALSGAVGSICVSCAVFAFAALSVVSSCRGGTLFYARCFRVISRFSEKDVSCWRRFIVLLSASRRDGFSAYLWEARLYFGVGIACTEFSPGECGWSCDADGTYACFTFFVLKPPDCEGGALGEIRALPDGERQPGGIHPPFLGAGQQAGVVHVRGVRAHVQELHPNRHGGAGTVAALARAIHFFFLWSER